MPTSTLQRPSPVRCAVSAIVVLLAGTGSALAQFVSDSNTITITLAGDTGFSPNHAPVRADGVARHGRFQTWAATTRAIAPLVDGDLSFVNVETVVTDRNDLARDLKGQRGPFNFRSHPAGLAHLVGLGFNVVSLANNHSMDYGVEGLRETLKHIGRLRRAGLKAAAGIGENRDAASRPEQFTVKGDRFAFSAIGIVTNNLARHRAGPDSPGQIAYRFDDDFDLVLDRLAATPADIRILSIHYGIEGEVRADQRQLRDWRGKAALGKGIDLVVGHHAHVPRGVEIAGRSVIFYGLGNFLHHGTADMAAKGVCKDFGIFAKVHLVRAAGRWAIGAVRIIPVAGTHFQPTPMPPAAATARIQALNHLAGTLGSTGQAQGMRFTATADGQGLHCLAAGRTAHGAVGALCRDWRPPGAVPADLRAPIAASCAR